MSALERLTAILNREYAKDPEIIDGADVHETAKVVDLAVAFTPVLERRLPPEHGFSFVDQPVRVVKDGMRYCLMWSKDYRWIDVESLKVMRARFLLWRGHFYRHLRNIPNGNQQQVIAWYFDGAVWQPEAGSALADALGIAS